MKSLWIVDVIINDQCKEDLLVITYNKLVILLNIDDLVMNLSQLSKHCLSIVCLNVTVYSFSFLFHWTFVDLILSTRMLSMSFKVILFFNYCFTLDCLDRYLLRFNEMIESCRTIYAILFRWLNSLKSGSFSLWSFNSCLFSIMEWLISSFLITFPFIQSLINELKFSIESSKGIYSIFINSFPYWTTNIICNDFLTLNQLNKFCRCINLGDLIAVLGPIDFVLGSVDLGRLRSSFWWFLY